jgi:hypothetical protein
MLLGQEDGSLLYFKNTAAPALLLICFFRNYANTKHSNASTLQLVDVNRDGLLDILMGGKAAISTTYKTQVLQLPGFFIGTQYFFGGVM